ncbi:AMP-dependent synthetase [Sinorhizobium meliloti]|nr:MULTISPECIES: AMP-binding protein [Sinorhizobium]ARS66227.1 AMP-dependent synthetase [Sinorhizobium meliloti RU11/001]MDE3779264.1 AMP-binding protein [Sinorhizobium meliloti]MDE3804779.1 AMP-binding protein [Sinorhizobium meliloti]RVG61657.1 AMP-dependent synthetase [Sinorhizobium meliloti]RVG89149.1 AMP-dependent synthetase [Sinorhizobium meliloti]
MDQIINRVANDWPSAAHSITIYGPGGRTELPLAELDRLARKTAVYLQNIGISAGDRIGIMARNRLEWLLIDLAALKIKAVIAAFEAGKFPATAALAERYALSIVFCDEASEEPNVLPIDGLLAALESLPEDSDHSPVVYGPDEVTTIKFTSGSTNEPKGLAATVGSIDSSICATQALFNHSADDKLFIFLPLSLLQQRYWVYSALVYGHDVVLSTYQLAYYALSREAPTVVMGVPAFFETLRKAISARVEGDHPVALCHAVIEAMGARIRYLWTGSAPASPDMLRFFEDCGMAIYEGYGMNETCIVTKNAPGAHRRGSVGKPIDRKHVSIDEEGIVVVRSAFPVNTRYLFCAPGDSERIFQPDGSVRTGDLGRIDEDGFLYILGRADDIVVLTNGRNVLVRPIEEKIRTCPEVENCIVVGSGDGRLLAILCVPHGEAASDAIKRHIADLNDMSRPDERIGRFLIVEEPFSIENGLLTSQYKPKRRAILARFAAEITQTTRGVS